MEKECKKIREIILETFIEKGGKGNFPDEVKKHLKGCVNCRNYLKGILLSERIFDTEETFFTEKLKFNTLLKVRKSKMENDKLPVLVISLFSLIILSSYVIFTIYIYRTILNPSPIKILIILISYFFSGVISTLLLYLSTYKNRNLIKGGNNV